ncbi:MAG: hypothetical protein N2255_03875 [Kiritimatiellae bacterium]|nr:hypothetical protein [Kiritimatiellia bacterium]
MKTGGSFLGIFRDLFTLRNMPTVTVNLMHSLTDSNDSFYAKVVRETYEYTQRRHPKFPLIKRDEYGVALAVLPATAAEYFMQIEGSARRNYRKAIRNGYRFERIEFNNYLDDIREIWRSAPVRQGPVPDHIRRGDVRPCFNPPSKSDVHDYPYFGILRDSRLVAYAGCLVAGEACILEQIFGHAAYETDGVVPLLIISIVGYVLEHHPKVRYYIFDTFLGATPSMRRFKRKFGFRPHRVKWVLG